MATFWQNEPCNDIFPCSPGSWVSCEYNNVLMHLTNAGGVMVCFVGSLSCHDSVSLISCSKEGGVTPQHKLLALLCECYV